MPIKPFRIGDVVFHRVTEEKGEVVRAFDESKYVVRVKLSPPWGEDEKEVLWETKDISRRSSHPRPLK